MTGAIAWIVQHAPGPAAKVTREQRRLIEKLLRQRSCGVEAIAERCKVSVDAVKAVKRRMK